MIRLFFFLFFFFLPETKITLTRPTDFDTVDNIVTCLLRFSLILD